MAKTQDVFGLFDPTTGALTALRTNDAAAPSLALLTAGQVNALVGLVEGSTTFTYDGSGRLSGYTKVINGLPVVHSVNWTNPLAPVITNTTGAAARTVTIDGTGKVTGLV